MNAPIETPSRPDESGLPPGASCALHSGPATFTCTRCGTFGCPECAFSEVRKREVCQACAATGLGEPVPWERRKELGNIRAFFRTVKLASFSPTRFFRTPTTHEGVFAAVAHGALTVTFGLFLSYVIAGALMLLAGGAVTAFVDDDGGPMGAIFALYGCFLLGGSPFLAALAGPANALFGQVLAAGCAHGVLALAKKTKGSFEDTLRVCSYSNSPKAFVPILGGITWFWGVGIEVVGLREVHRCGTDWAAFAAIGYRLAFTLVIVLGYTGLLFATLATLPTAQ